MDNTAILKCPFTDSTQFSKIFEYNQKPEGEIAFAFNSGDVYKRDIWQCKESKHYLSVHDMDMSQMYSEDYVNATYKDEEGVHSTFKRIISLDPSKSDNIGRVRRITEFSKEYFNGGSTNTVLDVGSGLGVFPYGIEQEGFKCTALDPDQRAVNHIANKLNISAVCADFMKFSTTNLFNVITFNKVLEHVQDPITMLAKSKHYLKKDGFIYIELPDGEMAAREGKQREEFFIDHIHIFSLLSTLLLIEKAGFTPIAIERLQEPSTKFTIRAFLRLTTI